MRAGPCAIALALGATLAVSACEDAGSEPTEIRDDPAMRAVVDGVAWEANYQLDRFIAEYTTAADELEVTGLEQESQTDTRQVTVLIEVFDGVGTYAIGGAESPAGAYYVDVEDGTSTFYGSGPDHTGSVTIDTLDTEQQWVTGTFYFTAVGDSGGVAVTDGMFRGRYVLGPTN